jgi:dTDP-4-dehydrorhamnose reductase
MKILVTGANGFLGQHLCLHLAGEGSQVIAAAKGHCRLPVYNGITYEQVELTNKQQVKTLLQKHTPDVIVHTAAMSKPDECNNNKDLAIDVNVTATKYLLQLPNTHFIYISTDFIFGEDGPHSEDEVPEPLNFYGETKLMAEEEVKHSGVYYTIVRPVFIYGKTWEGLRPTFLHWVKDNLEKGKPIKVVSDQQRTPTYVLDICKGISSIIKIKATGDFHFAGKDILSPYDMAVITANTLGLDSSLIQNVTSETFPEPVRRAKRSGLKIDKAVKELAYAPVSFEEGVKLTFSIE